jgi:hypothetical protein
VERLPDLGVALTVARPVLRLAVDNANARNGRSGHVLGKMVTVGAQRKRE